jgi:hypothetical protein
MRKSAESENVALAVEWEKGFLTQNGTYRDLDRRQAAMSGRCNASCLPTALSNTNYFCWVCMLYVYCHKSSAWEIEDGHVMLKINIVKSFSFFFFMF